MNEELKPIDSASDISSSSSWSVLKESPSSGGTSLDDIADIGSKNELNDNTVKEDENAHENEEGVNSTYVTIPDSYVSETKVNLESVAKSSAVKKKNKKTGKKCRCCKHRNLTLILLIALSITGTTLVRRFSPDVTVAFSDDVAGETMEKSSEPFVTSTKPIGPDIPIAVENMNVIREYPNIQGLGFLKEREKESTVPENEENEVCDLDNDEEIYEDIDGSVELKTLIKDMVRSTKDKLVNTLNVKEFKNVTNTVMNQVRKLLQNPNFYLLLYTLMQDICIVKLLNELNKADNSKLAKKNKKLGKTKVNITNTMQKVKKNSKVNKPIADEQVISNICQRYPNDTDPNCISPENGKSLCERRYEYLENQWETLRYNHHQKIQKIREKFRNEICKPDSGYPLIRQRIELIREKYLQRLKHDREKYFHKLRKIREERQKLLKDECLRKKTPSNTKETGVGNYAIIFPNDTEFLAKLNALKNQSVADSAPDLKPNPAFTNLRQKSYSTNPVTDTNTNDTMETSKSETQANLGNISHVLPPNAHLSDKNIVDRIIADIFTKLHLNNTTKENNTASKDHTYSDYASEQSSSENENNYSVKLMPSETKVKDTKAEVYELVFDKDAKKIKQADKFKWDTEKFKKQRSRSPGPLSKQDPQKSHKDKIQVGGRYH